AAVALLVIGGAVEVCRIGIGEEGFDLATQAWLVGFDGEQVVGSCVADCRRNRRIGGDGVDRDERTLQAVLHGKPFDEGGNGGDFIALAGNRLLAEHQAARGGEGGD